MRCAFGVLVAGLVLFGCAAPEPPKVFVNLDKLTQVIQAAEPAQQPYAGKEIVSSGTIPGSQSETIFLGLSEAELASTLSKAKTAQEVSLKRIYDQRLAVLEGQLESDTQSLKRALEPKHQEMLDIAIAETRVPFERVSNQVGKLTLELTSIIAFPDDPNQLATGWNEIQREKRQKRAEEIREELRVLDLVYREERDDILNRVNNRIAEDLRQVAIKSDRSRKEQIEAILSNLNKFRSEAKEQLSLKPRVKSAYNLAGQASKSVTVKGSAAKTDPPEVAESYRSPRWIAQEKAKIFAAVRGYVLVDQKDSKKDATEECIVWLKEYWAGRWAKLPPSSQGR